ncbi:hypothetical protein TNCV_2274811 [Trichonephila clavipes]|nr:hypothetical protein TNCV_2274811 [Trichonephila clavipes]
MRAGAPLTIGEAYLKIIMSSFLVLSEGDTLETGGVMDKCVQMLDKELWRLGPDGPGDERRKKERLGVLEGAGVSLSQRYEFFLGRVVVKLLPRRD